MRKHMLFLTSSLAFALAGCGAEVSEMFPTEEERAAAEDITVESDQGSGSTKVKITGPDGEEVVGESGADVPVKLPDGFSTYPGAKVVSNVVVRQGDTPGSMIMLESDDDPAKIVAFYKKQAEDAGMEIELEADMGVSQMISAQRGSDGTTLTASASRAEGENKTTAQLIVAGSKSD